MTIRQLAFAFVIILILVVAWFTSWWVLLGIPLAFLFRDNVTDIAAKVFGGTTTPIGRCAALDETVHSKIVTVDGGDGIQINYPIPPKFQKQLQSNSDTTTDFQAFLGDNDRITKTARFAEEGFYGRHEFSDGVNKLIQSHMLQDSYMFPRDTNLYYACSDASYDKLLTDMNRKMREVEAAAKSDDAMVKNMKREIVAIEAARDAGDDYCMFQDKYCLGEGRTIDQDWFKLYKDRPWRLTVIPIGIINGFEGGHWNVLIHDSTDNSAFLFDPHVDSPKFDSNIIQKSVIDFMSDEIDLEGNLISLAEHFTCPKFARSAKFRGSGDMREELVIQGSDQLCQTWALLGLLVYVNNIEMPIQTIFKAFNDQGPLKYALQFLYYLESIFKDTKEYQEYTDYGQLELPIKKEMIEGYMPWLITA